MLFILDSAIVELPSVISILIVCHINFIVVLFQMLMMANVYSRNVRFYFKTAIVCFLSRIILRKFSELNKHDFRNLEKVLKHYIKLRSDLSFLTLRFKASVKFIDVHFDLTIVLTEIISIYIF